MSQSECVEDVELYCEVFDKNVPGLTKHFDASIQFLQQELLIICMDFGQRKPSEVYFKTNPKETFCPTFHKLSYHAIRFVMLQGRTKLTIFGDRQNVIIRLRSRTRPSIETILNQLVSEDDSTEPMFTPINKCHIQSFIGGKSYARFTSIIEAIDDFEHSQNIDLIDNLHDIQFWTNDRYGLPCESGMSRSMYDCLREQIHEEAMERICHLIRRMLIDSLKTMRNQLAVDTRPETKIGAYNRSSYMSTMVMMHQAPIEH
ncbi:hypothetical protein RDWZM_005654 [Blomia tropicalis]|uniref:Uncharacterized protein n=1 Tax=Blomia tropicalis TaxID=40697 RepID=A0A9Q0M8U2_BLOTA|nr:hypothetical protein RDWZM_005654 [Blomia tropicalis]